MFSWERLYTITFQAGKPSQVHVTVSRSLSYLIRTGWTATPGRKAPGRKAIKHDLFVQVPSGNIRTCCHSCSGLLLSAMCRIVFCLEFGSFLRTAVILCVNKLRC